MDTKPGQTWHGLPRGTCTLWMPHVQDAGSRMAPSHHITAAADSPLPTPAHTCRLLPTPAHPCPHLPVPDHICPLSSYQVVTEKESQSTVEEALTHLRGI